MGLEFPEAEISDDSENEDEDEERAASAAEATEEGTPPEPEPEPEEEPVEGEAVRVLRVELEAARERASRLEVQNAALAAEVEEKGEALSAALLIEQQQQEQVSDAVVGRKHTRNLPSVVVGEPMVDRVRVVSRGRSSRRVDGGGAGGASCVERVQARSGRGAPAGDGGGGGAATDGPSGGNGRGGAAGCGDGRGGGGGIAASNAAGAGEGRPGGSARRCERCGREKEHACGSGQPATRGGLQHW